MDVEATVAARVVSRGEVSRHEGASRCYATHPLPPSWTPYTYNHLQYYSSTLYYYTLPVLELPTTGHSPHISEVSILYTNFSIVKSNIFFTFTLKREAGKSSGFSPSPFVHLPYPPPCSSPSLCQLLNSFLCLAHNLQSKCTDSYFRFTSVWQSFMSLSVLSQRQSYISFILFQTLSMQLC